MLRIASLVLLMISKSLVGETLSKEEFAYGIEVPVSANQLHEFSVPDTIYENIQHANLSDLRIFAPDGSIAPYSIFHQQSIKTSTQQRVETLTAFPVEQAKQRSFADLNLHVERNESGTIINLNTARQDNTDDKNIFYVIDLGERHNKDISALQLRWNSDAVNKANINIDSSPDLVQWKNTARGAVFSLTHANRRLLRDTIKIRPRERYLKLYPPNNGQWRLHSAHAIINERFRKRQEPIWTIAGIHAIKPNNFIYYLNGAYPINAFRVIPTRRNTIYDIKVSSGINADVPSTRRYRGLAYSLSLGNDVLTPDPIKVSGHNHRYWNVEIFDKDSDDNSAPTFKISWYPHRIRFLSNQPGNYTIAYGSASINHRGAPLPQAIDTQRYDSVKLELPLPDEIGGSEKLVPPPQPRSYSKFILWSILGIVLLVMGYMAYWLTKQMK